MTLDKKTLYNRPSAASLKKELKIKLTGLPKREDTRDNNSDKKSVGSLSGNEGSLCRQNCDCKFGLVCDNGICTEDW